MTPKPVNKRRHYAHSSSFKMALLFTILLSLSASVLSYCYYFARGHFAAGSERLLSAEDDYLAIAAQNGTLPQTLTAAAQRPGHVYLLWDAQGRHLAGNLDIPPSAATVPGTRSLTFRDNRRLYTAHVFTLGGGRTLLSGIDITDGVRVDRLLRYLSLLAILFMAAVVLVSFVISTFVVSRTNQIAETAREIMATGDLSRRIDVNSQWDDLSNMAFVLNALLTRVQALMQGIRDVSDNIAHDLRTPLTRLIGTLETLRGRPALYGDPAALALSDAASAETTRLLATFNALLRISSVETGIQRRNFADIDLRRIVSDVVDFYEPLAEHKGISLNADLSEVQKIRGDRDILFQSIANVLDNALKFTPPGGRIRVELRAEDGCRLTVIDSGPGISPADREKVFDRFYRTEASRTLEGNGLGLSLVAAAVALHDGDIVLSDAEPGLRMDIYL